MQNISKCPIFNCSFLRINTTLPIKITKRDEAKSIENTQRNTCNSRYNLSTHKNDIDDLNVRLQSLVATLCCTTWSDIFRATPINNQHTLSAETTRKRKNSQHILPCWMLIEHDSNFCRSEKRLEKHAQPVCLSCCTYMNFLYGRPTSKCVLRVCGWNWKALWNQNLTSSKRILTTTLLITSRKLYHA